jgi:hypothetical protein
VCVYEQSSSYFTPLFEYIGAISVAPLLVYPVPITEWTHVTMVFNNGQPSLYLNGQLVRRGLKSIGRVHPGVVGQHTQVNLAFAGEGGGLRQFDRALTEAEIAPLMASMPLPPAHPAIPAITLTRNHSGGIEATVRQPGDYALTGADGTVRTFRIGAVPPPLVIAGPWTVNFPPNLGAPRELVLNELISWTEHPDPGVKYYSGTAIYHHTFNLPEEWAAPHRRIYLDLGRVEVLAGVKLNGRSLGLVWKTPFRVEVTGMLRPGPNALEITVVNLPANRQIGDEFLPEDSDRNADGSLKQWPAWLNAGRPSPTGRQTFATTRVLKRDDPLEPSGLLGPVTLEASTQVDVR